LDDARVREAEDALRRIHGVANVAIDHSADGIDAIHVVSEDDRPPKQIVRDVVSTLRAVLNLTIDHKKVSVAQMGRPPEVGGRSVGSPPYARTGDRVALRSITVRDFGREREAEVVLACSGREARGVARGGVGTVRTGRLMANATVRALERFVDSRYRLDIEEVRYVSLAAREAMIVSANVADDRHEIALLGSGWVTDDLRRAAVQATLDAFNRVFGRLDRRRHVEYEVGPTSPARPDQREEGV